MRYVAILILFLFIVFVGSCCPKWSYVEEVKAHSAEIFAQNGFVITGYEGYSAGIWGVFGYGGACVWYQVHTMVPNGITYDACLQKWGSEYHMYNLTAIDAIRPK